MRTHIPTKDTGGGAEGSAATGDDVPRTFRQNVCVPNRRPRLELIASSASPEEAAAVVAAVERFMRATAPVAVAAPEGPDPWARAALLEGVSGAASGDDRDPWINT
jgi:hypothetical protein